MPVTIQIPMPFRPVVAGRSPVAMTEGTVGEVSTQLGARSRGVLHGLTQRGEVRRRLEGGGARCVS
jgi:hypothetical protein